MTDGPALRADLTQLLRIYSVHQALRLPASLIADHLLRELLTLHTTLRALPAHAED